MTFHPPGHLFRVPVLVLIGGLVLPVFYVFWVWVLGLLSQEPELAQVLESAQVLAQEQHGVLG